MPKGIWTYGSTQNKLPIGYDLDSFKEELTKKFKIIDFAHTEDNHITFFCEKKLNI